MSNERQRRIRKSQENARMWREKQLRKDCVQKNISEKVIPTKNLKWKNDKKKYKWKVIKRKYQMLPEKGEGCRCKGKTPKSFSLKIS